jgi:hypothetical protein
MGKAILFFLIPVVIATMGIIGITASKKAEVVHIPAAYGPGTGYALQPEQYTVTASSHYKWHHGTKSIGLIIIGFVLFAAGGFYVDYLDNEVKKGTWIVLAVLWLAGFICIFGKHLGRYYESKTFERTISAEVYEQSKGDLDAIFRQ